MCAIAIVKAVASAAGRVDESDIADATLRHPLRDGIGTGLDDLQRDERLDIGSELRANLSRGRGGSLSYCVADPVIQRLSCR